MRHINGMKDLGNEYGMCYKMKREYRNNNFINKQHWHERNSVSVKNAHTDKTKPTNRQKCDN